MGMPAFTLDSEMSAFIDKYLDASGLSISKPIEQQRADYNWLVQTFRSPRPDFITSRDALLNGRHGPIPIRRYQHTQSNTSARILFLHGGGFMLGNLETHDDVCADICAATRCELVSVNYRHAPEFLHPVQIDDVEDALCAEWHENLILVGISAGGTLAAGTSHRLRLSPQKAAAQVLVYPSLGGDLLGLESYRIHAHAPLLSTEDVRFYRNIRCREETQPDDDPEFYPLSAQDFGGLPPTVVISADIDPLRDDSEFYARKLQNAGIEARWINQPGLVHDFIRARYFSERARQAFADITTSIVQLANRQSA